MDTQEVKFVKSYIHPTAQVHPSVIIEDDVYIGAYCIIGHPPEWKGEEEHQGRVIIRKGARLTGMVTVDSGTYRRTEIGEGCYLMKHSHVGHDAILEENVTLSVGVAIGGHCQIGKNSNIGMNAAIHQKVIVPEGVMIGACGFVGKKSALEPNKKYAGVPIRLLGENIKK